MGNIELFAVVALLVDRPEHGLRRGDVGTIIDVFAANEHHPAGYLLEFVAQDGSTITDLEVTDASQIVELYLIPERQAA